MISLVVIILVKNRLSDDGKGALKYGVYISDPNLIGLKDDCWDTGLDLIYWDLCSCFPGANVTSSRYKFSKRAALYSKKTARGQM